MILISILRKEESLEIVGEIVENKINGV